MTLILGGIIRRNDGHTNHNVEIGGTAKSEDDDHNILDKTRTTYVTMFFSDASFQRDAIEQRMPLAGTISSLYISLDGSPGGGSSYTFTVLKNGTATGVTCAITGSSTQCADLTNSADFAAGDGIVIQSTPSREPGKRQMRWTAVYGQ